MDNQFVIENGVLMKYTGTEAWVILPDSVKAISRSAFNLCEKVETICIPKGLTGNVCCDFIRCFLFRGYEVSPENPAYASREGILYNKDMTTLIYCPNRQGTLEVPETVTQIGEYAFCGCEISGIHLPAGLQIIGAGAFENCAGLTQIKIPDSVTYIGCMAFRDCWRLQYIHLPPDAEIEDEEYLFQGAFSRIEIDGRGGYFYGQNYGNSW